MSCFLTFYSHLSVVLLPGHNLSPVYTKILLFAPFEERTFQDEQFFIHSPLSVPHIKCSLMCPG